MAPTDANVQPERAILVQLLARKLDLPLDDTDKLLGLARVRSVNKGEVLFKQGEASNSFFLIVQGQLKGQRTRPDGQVDLTLSFFPGEMIGELGFFDRSPRTLSILARKDAVLIELDDEVLERFGQQSRAVHQHLIRILVSRFKRELGYSRPLNLNQLMLFQSHVRPEGLRDWSTEMLRHCLAQHAEVRVQPLNQLHSHAPPPSTPGRWTLDWIDANPGDQVPHTLVDELDSITIMLCASTLGDAVSVTHIQQQLHELDSNTQIWLVLVHEAAWVESNVAMEVRRLFGVGCRILHIRHGSKQDFVRVSRHLLGISVGLVLGGGGARGFAHAGFYRALEESGIVVDAVGGTSMGALVAALIATGHGAKWVEQSLALSFKRGLPFKFTDYWIPRHGFVKSRAVDQVYQTAFAQACIEDQPIPYFAVSCNLTTGGQHLYDEGPVWKAVRASTSIPVYFEPFMDGRQVMVDGAMVNNVPVDTMRKRGAYRVIAVDVGLEEDICAHMNGQSAAQMPSMMKSLMRVIELGGIEKSRQARAISDVYVQPSIEKIGLMEFERREEIVNLGYEAGLRAIPDILVLTEKLLQNP